MKIALKSLLNKHQNFKRGKNFPKAFNFDSHWIEDLTNDLISYRNLSAFKSLESFAEFRNNYSFYIFYKKLKKIKSKRQIERNFRNEPPLEYDPEPLINILKKKIKFQYLNFDEPIACRICFRFTGSNMFGTITTRKGEVLFSYSAGIFKGLVTRKEKSTIFVAKQLGELIALRLYKSNAKEIQFVPNINHMKMRVLLRFLYEGFQMVSPLNITKYGPVRKVMRNGVRLRKIPRK